MAENVTIENFKYKYYLPEVVDNACSWSEYWEVIVRYEEIMYGTLK